MLESTNIKLILLLALLAGSTKISEANKIRYDNFRLFRLTAESENAVEKLKWLKENPGEYSFWGQTSAKSIDILVPPHLIHKFNDTIQLLHLKSELIIPNVQQLIDNERKISRDTKQFGWDDYHTLNEINDWLVELAEKHPNIVTLVKGGVTYEERSIIGVKVSFSRDNEYRAIFIEGNIHAREWISSAVVTYILIELLTSQDPAVRTLAEYHDWYIFPVTNPDGFVYTHITDRLWRKTRTPYSPCYGADPNRNWDFHYNEGGSSDDTCSESYRGPYAFSENTTRTLAEYITTIGPQLKAYISFHSYSQFILIPYGFSAERFDNFDELNEIGLAAAESLARRYGTQYTVGNWLETLYISSGVSVDWVKGVFNTSITYTYELRDTGRYGFILPADQILPTAEETLDSLVTMFEVYEARNRNKPLK